MAQDKLRHLFDVGWPRYVVDALATVQAPKENPKYLDPLSMLSTKRTLYDSTAGHAQYHVPHVRVQIILVSSLNKKYQT